MHTLNRAHPQYGWSKNKGAPCEKHFKGIDENGVLMGVHRTKFWPFQPNREKRDNEPMWHWRRGLWRQKTLENVLGEIETKEWMILKPQSTVPEPRKSSTKKSERISSKSSKEFKRRPPKDRRSGTNGKGLLIEQKQKKEDASSSQSSRR